MRDAIADARRRGIAVMLVTGRRLDDLRRVAGDLDFVDGVVAENGALVHFPRRRPDDGARTDGATGIRVQAAGRRYSVPGRTVPDRRRCEDGATDAGRDP